MQNIFTRFLLVFILALVGIKSDASHIYGGQITYVSVDSVNYNVYYTFYRDCSGMYPSMTTQLLVSQNNIDTSYAPLNVNIKTLKPQFPTSTSCGYYGNGCDTPTNYQLGVQEVVYEYQINVSRFSDCWITLGVQSCCRSGMINTFQSLSAWDRYVETKLNKCIPSGVSSLYFNDPFPVATRSYYDQLVSLAGRDSTNSVDSFSFVLVNPRTTSSANTPYASSYAYNRPIAATSIKYYPGLDYPISNSFTLDTFSGTLCYTSLHNSGLGMYSVKIESFVKVQDSMVKSSIIYKDQSISSITLSNSPGSSRMFMRDYLDTTKRIIDPLLMSEEDTVLIRIKIQRKNGDSLYVRFHHPSLQIRDSLYLESSGTSSSHYFLDLWCYAPRGSGNFGYDHLHVSTIDSSCAAASGWQTISKPIKIINSIRSANQPKVTLSNTCNSILASFQDTAGLRINNVSWSYKNERISQKTARFIAQDTGWQLIEYEFNNGNTQAWIGRDSIYIDSISPWASQVSYTMKKSCVSDTLIYQLDSLGNAHDFSIYYGITLDTFYQNSGRIAIQDDSVSLHVVDTLGCIRIFDFYAPRNRVPNVFEDDTFFHCFGNLNNRIILSRIDSSKGVSPYSIFLNSTNVGTHHSFYPSQDTALLRTIVDSAGCSRQDSVFVKRNAAFTVYAGEDTSTCLGNTIQLLGQHSARADSVLSILWDDTSGAISKAYTFTGPSYVKLKIERIDGCAMADSFYISEYTGYQVNIVGDTVLCYPSQDTYLPTYSGGTAFQSIQWTYGGNTSNFSSYTIVSPAQNGQNQLIVQLTDSAKCVARDTIDVYLRFPSFSLNTTSRLLCLEDTFLIYPSGFNGFNPVIYNWNSGQSSSDTFIYTPNSRGSIQNIRLEITDNFGCLSDTFITLRSSPFQAQIDAFPLVCGGDSIRVKAKYSGALGSLQYDWEIGGSNYSDSDFFFVPSAGLNYQIKMNVRDANGCLISDSFDFVTTNFQVGLSGDTLLCVGESASILATPRLGPGPYQFQWTGTGNAIDSVFHIDNSGYSKGTHLIAVQVSDANNCLASDTVVIEVNKFAAPALSDISLCFGDSLLISSQDTAAHGTAQYTWTIKGQTFGGRSLHHSPLAEQVYSLVLRATDAQGCSIIDTLYVDVRELKANLTGDLTTCGGDTINLSYQASGYFGSLNAGWFVDGVFFADSNQVQFTDSQFVIKALTLNLRDANQCELTLNDSLRFYRQTQISFSSPGFCEDEGSIVLQNYAQPSGGIFKDAAGTQFTSVSSQALGRGNHAYTYVAGDAGCEDSSTFALYIHPEPQISFYSFDTIGIQNHQATFFASVIAQQPKLEWDFGDGNTLADSLIAQHTYTDTGYFDVTLKVADSVCTKRLTKTNYVYVIDSHILVVERPELIEMALYPNPLSQGSLNLSLAEEIDFISIQTIQGQELIRTGALNPGVHQMDLRELVPGTYLVLARKDNLVRTFKLIKLEHKQH